MRPRLGGITLIETAAACLAAIIFHECFHVLAARIFKMSLWHIRPLPGGVKARLRGKVKSFKRLVAVYFSGPGGNFLIAACFICSRGFGRYIFEANLAIGIFNLLPIYPLDGGQIFLIVMYKAMGSNRAFKHLKKISRTLRIGLYFLGITQIILFKNPSIIIATVFLPGTRLLEETVSMMKIETLLTRKQRILSKKIYPARHIVVMEDCCLGDIMQKLDYDRFHIIYVLNGSLEIMGQITEQQIIKALQVCNAQDKIRDIFFLGT